MPQPKLIDRAIDDIADGSHPDWEALTRDAPADQQELLKYLRLLGEIAALHQSTTDAGAPLHRAVDPLGDARSAADGASQSWGRYRLTEKVGEGSFGSVYRAWDPELEREIAIKILHNPIADRHLKERLLREGRALAKVDHANVVTVFSVEAHGDRVGLCMEFVRGETLESALKTQGTLNAREAMLVGEDVCRALAAVHAAGFVHRDVKARNVMRERAGRIVLMDFGAGRESEQLQRSGGAALAGTPVYMAPEVLAGFPASARSDVYSVGVLLYHLVTNAYPIEGASIEEIRAAHMQGRRKLLSERRSDLAMSFVHVVERALAVNPKERYASAGALLEALGTIGFGVPRASAGVYLLRGGLATIGLATALIAFGALTSWHFNYALGRAAFASETAVDWLVWGARSFVAMAVLSAIAVSAVALLLVGRTVLLTVFSGLRDVDARLRSWLARVAQRWRLNDTTVISSGLLIVTAAAFLAVWWGYWPLVTTVNTVPTARPEDLALLAPDHLVYRANYRKALTWLVILSTLGWYCVIRLAAARRQDLNRGMLAGGAAVLMLSLVLLEHPFRLLYHNAFERVVWNDSSCYVIGERPHDLLLFCPQLQPRTRTVANDAPLTRTGVTESLFTRFSSQKGD